MEYDKFLQQVQYRGQFSKREDAGKAIRATLFTLGERLDKPDADELCTHLPAELKQAVCVDHHEQYDVSEFCGRVSQREHQRRAESVYHARAVLSALREDLAEEEAGHVLSHLPSEYDALFHAEIENGM